MTGSIIRTIQNQDILSIVAIEQSDPYSPWSESVIKDCLNREHYYNWALVDGEQLEGYIICNVPHDECHVMSIAIALEYRHQGKGKQLLEYAIAQVRSKASYIILEVRAENLIARQLYESRGFKQIGLRRNYYQQGEGNRDALVYRLDLIK